MPEWTWRGTGSNNGAPLRYERTVEEGPTLPPPPHFDAPKPEPETREVHETKFRRARSVSRGPRFARPPGTSGSRSPNSRGRLASGRTTQKERGPTKKAAPDFTLYTPLRAEQIRSNTSRESAIDSKDGCAFRPALDPLPE
jgi:hypothetical protein